MGNNKNNLIKIAFNNSILVFGYIVLVAWFFQLAPLFFGKVNNNVLAASAFLLLFIFSATVTGALVLGKPILLYLEGAKGDAIELFLYTIGFLGGVLVLAFVILVIMAQIV